MKLFRSRQAKSTLAYSTGPFAELHRWAHLGTKQASVERAVDLAMRSPNYYNSLLEEIARSSTAPNATGMLWQYAVAWRTNLLEARLDLTTVGVCDDPQEEDQDWPKHAFEELNKKRRNSFRSRTLRMFGCRAAKQKRHVHVLSYFNRAEHFGSESYVLTDRRALSELRQADLFILIVGDEVSPGHLAGLPRFLRENFREGLFLMLSRKEAIRVQLNHNNHVASVMPFSRETLLSIDRIMDGPPGDNIE
ncbi:hypothetical protein GGE50_003811 [Rhizobium leguminosarum]|uniref:hypothetical protein n=1 Tax=Rhizobium leguminosarum TaxID=384 RepID=UPI001611ADDB|nr:hypothetical protein [Rhizobium leguminosarum]MBB4587907.1 hypothetical protein [Rhizobium leguminosarum]